jgi:hypothetical protein
MPTLTQKLSGLQQKTVELEDLQVVTQEIIDVTNAQRRNSKRQIHQLVERHGCQVCKQKVPSQPSDMTEKSQEEAGVPFTRRRQFSIPPQIRKENLLCELKLLLPDFENIRVVYFSTPMLAATLRNPITLHGVRLGRFSIAIPFALDSSPVFCALRGLKAYSSRTLRRSGKYHPLFNRPFESTWHSPYWNISLSDSYISAFRIVRDELSNENKYLPADLDKWKGFKCIGCEEVYSPNDIHKCANCNRLVCEKCKINCIQNFDFSIRSYPTCPSCNISKICSSCGKSRFSGDVYGAGDCIFCKDQRAHKYSTHYQASTRLWL